MTARNARHLASGRRRIRAAGAALVLSAVFGWAACTATPAGDTTPDPGPAAVPAAAGMEIAPAVEMHPRRDTPATPAKPGTPTRLVIPDINVNAPIVTTRVVDGEFLVPDNIATVGWDQGSPKPGAKRGTALMAGHLDDQYGNDGALRDLLDLDQGDTITVGIGRGDLTYRVTSVNNYVKTGLPPEIVSRTGKHQIALVTCGGPLVRGSDGYLHYRDNIVVWAELAT